MGEKIAWHDFARSTVPCRYGDACSFGRATEDGSFLIAYFFDGCSAADLERFAGMKPPMLPVPFFAAAL